jgi:hypothetical protein
MRPGVPDVEKKDRTDELACSLEGKSATMSLLPALGM